MSLFKRLTGFTALAVAAGLLIAAPAQASGARSAEASRSTRLATAAHKTPPRPGSLQDPNLHFAGRWDTSDPTTYIGNWESPYVATGFTGTSVKATIRDAATVYASIDSGPIATYSAVSGTIDLTPTPLAAGEHSVWFSYRTGELDTCAIWPSPCATFQGFTLDPGARTLAQPAHRKLIEFVGDSITVGALSSKNTVTSYSWLTSEQLGVDHTNIARSGACLVQLSNCFGIGANFGKQTIGGTADWDFDRYQADAVVVNLGTNDAGRGVSGPDFQAAYTALLQQARTKYPHAALFAFETFRQRYLAETQAAVQTLNDAGDANVYYINTEGWLTDADYVDGGHPNDGGHAKIAQKLAPILAPHIGVTLPGTPADRNIQFTGRWDTTDPAAYVANWDGAYLTTRFTGTTVTLNQRNTIDFWASIDGGEDVSFVNVSGPVTITPTPLAPGVHSLRVSYRNVGGSYHGDAVFQGLTLDAGARTVPRTAPPQPAGADHGRQPLIEFVGDSITAGQTSSKTTLTSYSWLVGERLGARHTSIGYGGGCLVAAADGCAGVSQLFFHTGFGADSALWDFDRYTADAVVINLGTNDLTHKVTEAEFQSVYEQFLRDVRGVYPHAEIFVLGTFVGRYLPQTEAAVATVAGAGDKHVTFVNTVGWLPAEGRTDSVHPNDLGHQLIADQLTPIIAAALDRRKGAHS
jgi:lysophospholipase L1-like esterase